MKTTTALKMCTSLHICVNAVGKEEWRRQDSTGGAGSNNNTASASGQKAKQSNGDKRFVGKEIKAGGEQIRGKKHT